MRKQIILALAGLFFLISGCRKQAESSPESDNSTVVKLVVPAEDEFDKFYKLRIEYFTKEIAIYESVIDQATAEQAAKDWTALASLQTKIKQLQEKLGQPSPERQLELNDKYAARLNQLSTRSLELSYSIASKSFGRELQIAQLQYMADQGDEDAKKALEIMTDPNAMAEFQAAQQAAEKERAKIKTDPDIDQAVKAYIKTTNELNQLLAKVTDGDTAKEVAPKAKELVQKWQTQGKTLNAFGPAAGKSTIKYQAELKASMGALSMTWMKLYNNKEASKHLKDVLEKIGQIWAGV